MYAKRAYYSVVPIHHEPEYRPRIMTPCVATTRPDSPRVTRRVVRGFARLPRPEPGFRNGFTLIELLVTLALVAIVAGLAAPSFSDLVQRNRAAAQVNTFLADINIARSEATRVRRTVVMCPRANTEDCDGSGMGSGGCVCANTGSWEDGWLTFADMNANGTLDSADALVAVGSALPATTELRRSGAGAFVLDPSRSSFERLAFRSRGTLVGAATTFALCRNTGEDADILDKARFVELSLSGRAGVRGKLASETTTAAACRFGRG